MKRAAILFLLKCQLIGLSAFLYLPGSSVAARQNLLKLDEVLKSVDCYYPEIRMARLEITKSQGAYLSTKGKFDPSVDGSMRSQPAGGYINNYGDTQLTIPTLYNGVKLFAGYRNGGGDWPIYYQNYLTNSGGEYRAGLSLPLLRDRLIDKERTDLLSSAQSIQLKQHEAEAVKIKIYQETIKAYWQWIEAGLQLQTFKHLLKLAQTRQHAIEQQAHQGALPKLSITENLQQIMQRKLLLNQGKMIFEQAGINLSLYYRDAKGHPKIPSERRLPPYVPSQSKPLTKRVTLLRQHPGPKILSNYSNLIKLKKNLAHNQLLPQLDATANTFKQNGTGGYPALLPQGALLSLSLKFPLFQREAKGNLIQAQSELHQIKAQKQFLYEQLDNELSKTLIGINRGYQQVALLKQELDLAKKVEHGETKKLYQGDSTLFLVNQREQATLQVRLNSIHAKAELEELKDKLRFFSSAQLSTSPIKKRK